MTRSVLLVATADDLAADLVLLHLRRRGVPFIRFNQENFPRDVAISWHATGGAAFRLRGVDFRADDIDSAWFRRGVRSSGENSAAIDFAARESCAFLNGMWEAMPWHWVNRPSAVRRAANKLSQLSVARGLGFCIPRTIITNSPGEARDFVGEQPSVVKAVTNGAVVEREERFVAFTTAIGLPDLQCAGEIQAAPAIYQERVANAFDLRVTVVGDRVFPIRIARRSGQTEVDWRELDPSQLCYTAHQLPSPIEAACVAMMAQFSLSFAAFDFIVTPAEEHVFLEVNPSGQWGWLEAATGMPITDAIVDLLTGHRR